MEILLEYTRSVQEIVLEYGILNSYLNLFVTHFLSRPMLI